MTCSVQKSCIVILSLNNVSLSVFVCMFTSVVLSFHVCHSGPIAHFFLDFLWYVSSLPGFQHIAPVTETHRWVFIKLCFESGNIFFACSVKHDVVPFICFTLFSLDQLYRESSPNIIFPFQVFEGVLWTGRIWASAAY